MVGNVIVCIFSLLFGALGVFVVMEISLDERFNHMTKNEGRMFWVILLASVVLLLMFIGTFEKL